MPAIALVDCVSVPLTVGQQVKLQGIVTALNPYSNRYNEVTIVLFPPDLTYPDVLVSPGGNSKAVPGPGFVKTVTVHQSMVTVGV